MTLFKGWQTSWRIRVVLTWPRCGLSYGELRTVILSDLSREWREASVDHCSHNAGRETQLGHRHVCTARFWATHPCCCCFLFSYSKADTNIFGMKLMIQSTISRIWCFPRNCIHVSEEKPFKQQQEKWAYLLLLLLHLRFLLKVKIRKFTCVKHKMIHTTCSFLYWPKHC